MPVKHIRIDNRLIHGQVTVAWVGAIGAKGRPVGLQIVGSYFDEARMLAVANAFQQVTDWHTKVPKGFGSADYLKPRR